jgi:hypothetical protein
MIPPTIDRIAEAVLYEGYILYPYRASSRKNRQRFTFGRVYPQAYGESQNGAEPFTMQTECLLRSLGERPTLQVRVRFLHPLERSVGLLPELPADIGTSSFLIVPELRVDNKLYQTWQEAVEREIRPDHRSLDSGANQAGSLPFHFSSCLAFDPIRNVQNQVIGAIIRKQQSLGGTIDIAVQPLAEDVFKISVKVETIRLYRSPN